MQRLFSTVTEMVEDESGFVVVLIGESGSSLLLDLERLEADPIDAFMGLQMRSSH